MGDLYDTLGVPRNATQEEIKRAYRRRAGETHPDKGGTEDAFTEVKNAYEVLSDDNKRQRYDNGEPIEGLSELEEVKRQLTQLFVQTIRHVDLGRTHVFNSMVSDIKSNLANVETKERANAEWEKKLNTARNRIKVKEGEENLFALVIDGQLRQLDFMKKSCEKTKEFLNEMVKFIENYEYEVDPSRNAITSTTTITFNGGWV